MPVIIRNAILVNEGKVQETDVLVKNGFIEKIAPSIDVKYRHDTVELDGRHLLPGVIDDQVHFREPGLTDKANIHSESRAAVAGGVTSFMEMPNTKPAAVTQELLEEKYKIASRASLANYSFYMGATNDNLEVVRKTDKHCVCGVKVFMGSSTGNMLVDNTKTLEGIFSECDHLIAVHSESESIIRKNLEVAQSRRGEDIPMREHAEIRSAEACYVSTKNAIELAKRHNTRLHILHISTADELPLFSNDVPLADKRITSEVCVHHLWFNADDYERLGGLIKCNPAIKEKHHQQALFQALLDNRLDVIATDHAPHTWDEKQHKYLECPSGLPLVQHPLLMMLEFYHKGMITLERVVEKMSHAPAECFHVRDRGYVREGYKADLVAVNLNKSFTVSPENIRYKAGWSPLMGYTFHSSILHTWVNGAMVFDEKKGVIERDTAERLLFN